jgi:hypothetical protein
MVKQAPFNHENRELLLKEAALPNSLSFSDRETRWRNETESNPIPYRVDDL